MEEADLKYGVKVNLRSIEGDADLYVSRTCKVPSQEDYQWASSADGDDVIKIMPGCVFKNVESAECHGSTLLLMKNYSPQHRKQKRPSVQGWHILHRRLRL